MIAMNQSLFARNRVEIFEYQNRLLSLFTVALHSLMKFQLYLSVPIFLLHLFFGSTIHAQPYKESVEYFSPPLEIPLFLSGNFAELRRNHFHSGIDIKTQGVEGQRVVAAAEGYVSRIRISAYGYGKALYLDHPNGLTTVYAHLQRLSPRIEEVARAAQSEEKSYEIDL